MKTLKLYPLDLYRLHHAEIGQFVSRFFEDFTKAGLQSETDEDFNKLSELLKSKLPTYDKAIAQIKQNEETQNIANLDKIRSADIQALRDSIKPYRKAKTEDKQTAYDTIKIVLDEYKNLTQESYEEQTKKTETLLMILKKDMYKEHIQTLNIGYFITEVEKSNKAFDDVFAKRSVQILQKETYNTKALRKEITDIYRKICDYILVLSGIKEDEFYTKTLEVINNSRKYYADLIARRK